MTEKGSVGRQRWTELMAKSKKMETTLIKRGYFPKVNRPGRQANHSPPSRTKVKNDWSYTSTPLHAFMAWAEAT